MSTITTADGAITVDYAEGEVLLECDASDGFWLSTDQALELAAALTGSVLEAMRCERANREPRKCGWCGDTRGLCGDVCVKAENE